MSIIMSPSDVYVALHDSYLRYLETSFHLKDKLLLEQFRRLLNDKTQPPLVRQPILEVSPGYKTGSTLDQLIGEEILTGLFRKFDAGTLMRPLYSHQDTVLRKAIIYRWLPVESHDSRTGHRRQSAADDCLQ